MTTTMVNLFDAAPDVVEEKEVAVTLPPNFRLNGYDINVGAGGRRNANHYALTILKQLEEEDRFPNRVEQMALAAYSGWGSMPNVFDPKNPTDGYWGKHTLKPTMGSSRWNGARQSVNTAFFTPPAIVYSMWDALAWMGFKGGKALDPSCGNGAFLGSMPLDLYENVEWTAVDKDKTSADITALLYPQADVYHKPIEKANIRPNHFDVTITNVPFGQLKVFDSDIDGKLSKSIHNYFFAKALQLTRAGGLVALITSSFWADSKETAVREYVSRHADLLGMVRLPVQAFKTFAGTEVTTDIVFLKVKEMPEVDDFEYPRWVGTTEITPKNFAPGYGGSAPVNNYFVDNPEQVLGSYYMASSQHGGKLVVMSDKPVDSRLKDALRNLPPLIYVPLEQDSSETAVIVTDGKKEGSFWFGKTGRVMQRLLGEDTVYKPKAKKTIQRVASMLTVRKVVIKLLAANLNPEVSDSKLKPLQARLVYEYQKHVSRYGFLNNNPNRSAFSSDPDCALLLAIEDFNKETGRGKKMSIFTKRVVGHMPRAETADTPQDALLISLNETGTLDFDRMCELTGIEKENLIYALKGKIFKAPNGKFVLADEYLSGNVRQKYREAKAASLTDPEQVETVLALSDILPPMLDESEVIVKMGASWIPEEAITQFLNEMIDVNSLANNLDDPKPKYEYKGGPLKAIYLRFTAEWRVEGSCNPHDTLLSERWGTSRINGVALAKLTMNTKSPTVKDRMIQGGREWYEVNALETEAAREKQGQLRDAFTEWLWRDSERKAKLLAEYNDKFNSQVARLWDGDFLTLPGTGVDLPTMRPHQKNAIWRVMQSSTTLLWHTTGAGKTFVSQLAGMELRRLKLRRKVWHVVINNNIVDYAKSFQVAYPGARLLVINSKQLGWKFARNMLAKAVTGDYDAVIITQDAFQRIRLKPETLESVTALEISIIEECMYDLSADDPDEKYTVKALQKRIDNLVAKLDQMRAKYEQDEHTVYWEDLGVDCLFVDEAHNYKNLYAPTKLKLPGVGGGESGRAYDMFVKTQYMTRRCVCGQMLAGRKHCNCVRDERVPSTLVFMTATPFPNALGEAYTMQRYLDYDMLLGLDIAHFDAWVQVFGDAVTSLEMKPSGKGWRLHTRLAKYMNVPDLIRLLDRFSDKQNDLVKLGVKIPKLITGDVQTIAVEPSDALMTFVDQCDARYANLRNKKPWEDNALMIIGDATKAATDMRMVGGVDEKGSKINAAVKNIARLYRKDESGLDGGSCQVVFLDMGVPKGKNFDLYNDMRTKLINSGVVPSHIAFVHEAKNDVARYELFERVNDGRVRIFFGSTPKIGMGVNIQRRLYAMHLIDCPWRPADDEQRRGRILRQGNLCTNIEIFRYVTKKSFDVYRWQILEMKARFLHQLMAGTVTDRVIEDPGMLAVSYAQAKAMASGDKMAQEQVVLMAKYRKINLLWLKHRRNVTRMIGRLDNLPVEIERNNLSIRDWQAAVAAVKAVEGQELAFAFRGYVYSNRAKAGAVLADLLDSLPKWASKKNAAKLQGFQVDVHQNFDTEAVIHVGKALIEVILGHAESGNISRMVNALKDVPARKVDRLKEATTALVAELEHFAVAVNSPFKHSGELEEVETRLEEIEQEFDRQRREQEMAQAEGAQVEDDNSDD